MSQFFAHSKPDGPMDEWQPLDDHLINVGELAGQFADAFGAREWGEYAGKLHDIGKSAVKWQSYLHSMEEGDCSTSPTVDHSSAGAQWASQHLKAPGHILAFVIAGHHSGLLDAEAVGACLRDRLKKNIEPFQDPGESLGAPTGPPALPSNVARKNRKDAAFSISFFTRMLFSCLTDADFLDTERFMMPEQSGLRPVWPDSILSLMNQALTEHAEHFTASTHVDRHREFIRQACLQKAPQPPGLFSLTVPTGGGKTLSSLAFALKHALQHDLRRVIYVIPFTSIIEQNADVFRSVMQPLAEQVGLDPVLEHHSNFDPERETVASRLTSQNWDSPLVVTTAVQFFESLFANRTSRCRKLHHLARSVIILDEAQTVPVEYLAPCLQALKELTKAYGTTVVLCTATQPAVHKRPEFPIGLENVEEIIPQPEKLYHALKRVEVVKLGKQTDTEIASRLRDEHQALCIVNTRNHAKILAEQLDGEQHVYHLSARMCPQHRTAILNEIRQKLCNGDMCLVISTQLIEAGVDVDFPVVFRSMAGIDAVAQAAGRCNRNGRAEGLARTYVFESEHQRSERYFAATADVGRDILDLYEDPLSLNAVEHFFRLYYWKQASVWDKKHILKEFRIGHDKTLPFIFLFATCAKKMKLIENVQRPVIIPWGKEGTELCERLRESPFPKHDVLRRLQRYSVTLPERDWFKHINRNIENVHEQFPVLISPELHYSDRFGLVLDDDPRNLLEA